MKGKHCVCRIFAAALALLSLGTWVLPGSVPAAQAADAVPKRIKILGIGNSYGMDTLRFVYTILKSCGVKDIQVEHACIGNSTVQQHYNNATKNPTQPVYELYSGTVGGAGLKGYISIQEVVASENWDYIMLQESPANAAVIYAFNGDAEKLMAYVRENCPNKDVKLGWMMGWSSRKEVKDISQFQDLQHMYEMIAEATESKIASNPDWAYLVPNGTAVQNLRTSGISEDEISPDTWHLGEMGEYLAGLCFVESIGISTQNVAWHPAVVKEEQLPILREALANALKTPFAVTPCSLTAGAEPTEATKAPATEAPPEPSAAPETTAPAQQGQDTTKPDSSATAPSKPRTGLFVGLGVAVAALAAAVGAVFARKKKDKNSG